MRQPVPTVFEIITILFSFFILVAGLPYVPQQRRGKSQSYKPTACIGIPKNNCKVLYQAWDSGKSMNISVWNSDCHRLDVRQEPAPTYGKKSKLQLEPRNPPYKPLVVEIRDKYFKAPKVTYNDKNTEWNMGGLFANCDNKGNAQQC